MYDPSTNSWSTLPDMPYACNTHSAAVANNMIYLTGLEITGSPSNKFLQFDPTNNIWTEKEPMPTARRDLGISTLDNKIFVLGGSGSSNSNINEQYDPITNSWKTLSPMNVGRYNFRAVALNGKIYALGGYTTNYSNTVDEYTPPVTVPVAPTTLSATAGNAQVTLTWTAVTGSTSYNIKRATTAGGPYTQIGTSTTNSYTDSTVTNGITYYYVVTAVNSGGESANSNEASATPVEVFTGRALLVVTMVNGTEKEYDLTMTQVNSFINWYDGRAEGTGSNYYIMNKNFNLGPFQNRKDYLVFDKIMNFEVMEYQE
ncbi:fibronectin type III domain-containing protein [Dehalobacter sp.]|uniref:Kelch repeat-containing protein n=1 Tax=Dehalobacter sp. TaxID=1962289 RepID=UPI0025866D4C|nr:fibronectin type III domain-containing protein [Dehalobacter sp.]MCG1026399.1 hypothetical protein [Dehalobacter sp.]